ncbi:MAG TPA: hypothetical protein PLL20_00795 [Phycisphaerae bacterium]|nr:hypothetical protein [Phycisphaerae bacterium]HRR87073.1 hypothetical protein [Phycisphaerae bacterium]
MPVETLLISGPRGGGKSTLARLIASQVLDRPAHYLRTRRSADGYTNAIIPLDPANDGFATGWASCFMVGYTPERVFETLPDGLREVRKIDRYGFAIIEADGDPPLRHAYPYDYRVFVMSPPTDVHQVFRDTREATQALQQVMQDTAAFASEIFGLFNAAGFDDGVGVSHHEPVVIDPCQVAVERLEIAESQIRGFLNSPLGVEIASRIQLQPEYHALVESDVVVINTGVGKGGEVMKECVKRIEKLLARVRHDARRSSILYWGNFLDTKDSTQKKLLKRLRCLFAMKS